MIHVETLPQVYRIVGTCIYKTYHKFIACVNCNIRTSCLSQFSLISILFNINKASKHCDCRRTITNALRPVHRNGSRIITAITEFNYILTERDEIIVHWLLPIDVYKNGWINGKLYTLIRMHSLWHLIWVFIVCSGLSVPKLRVIVVHVL